MTRGGGPNAGDKASRDAKYEELAELFDDGFPDCEELGEQGDEMEHDHSGLGRVDSHGHSHTHPNGRSKHGVKADGTMY